MFSLFWSMFRFRFQVAFVTVLAWLKRLTGNLWEHFSSFHSLSSFFFLEIAQSGRMFPYLQSQFILVLVREFQVNIQNTTWGISDYTRALFRFPLVCSDSQGCDTDTFCCVCWSVFRRFTMSEEVLIIHKSSQLLETWNFKRRKSSLGILIPTLVELLYIFCKKLSEITSKYLEDNSLFLQVSWKILQEKSDLARSRKKRLNRGKSWKKLPALGSNLEENPWSLK